jgi:predicted Fe-Mo cluster-binding NifX family protein
MKITIPTIDDSGLKATISAHFDKSPFLTVVNTQTGEIQSVGTRGQHLNKSELRAESIAGATTDVILCPNLGRRALRYFRKRRVEVYTGATGTVGDALVAYYKGRLLRAIKSCSGRTG